jgi:hypothetical protein
LTVFAHAGPHETVGELLAGRFWWLLPLLSFALAMAIGRWKVILLPGLIWLAVAVYLEGNNGWHGFGWGDFGIAFTVLAALAAFVAVPVGIATHHVAARLYQPKRAE